MNGGNYAAGDVRAFAQGDRPLAAVGFAALK